MQRCHMYHTVLRTFSQFQAYLNYKALWKSDAPFSKKCQQCQSEYNDYPNLNPLYNVASTNSVVRTLK